MSQKIQVKGSYCLAAPTYDQGPSQIHHYIVFPDSLRQLFTPIVPHISHVPFYELLSICFLYKTMCELQEQGL